MPTAARAADPARFWKRAQKTDTCWLWTGAVAGFGYGVCGSRGRRARAHRVAYTLEVGPIPPGMQVLHRCDTPRCVRPDHLFLGTQLDNMRDMHAKGRDRNQNTDKVVCKHGHPLTPENVYVYRDGHRGCRPCLRRDALAYYYRTKHDTTAMETPR